MTAPRLSPDLTPYLHGLAPDPHAFEDARAFAADLHPAPLQDVGSIVLCLSLFHREKAGPGLPAGLSEAVGVLSYAASGLFALLEADHGPADGLDRTRLKEWKTLARARLWAREKKRQARAGLTALEAEDIDTALLLAPEEVEGFAVQLLARPDLLRGTIGEARAAGRLREVARFAAWALTVFLLEEAPTLPDGASEDLTAALLEALTA